MTDSVVRPECEPMNASWGGCTRGDGLRGTYAGLGERHGGRNGERHWEANGFAGPVTGLAHGHPRRRLGFPGGLAPENGRLPAAAVKVARGR
ncbi:hypothetical protein ABT144_16225 [Streptomyces sp. NPDC002039]|uniref:hypothetical protein n=1 Tax=Streptomyces sp. NPDC002039 TaxID=3154660 RepID=UPI003322D0FA